jgi:hypothetical protein
MKWSDPMTLGARNPRVVEMRFVLMDALGKGIYRNTHVSTFYCRVQDGIIPKVF